MTVGNDKVSCVTYTWQAVFCEPQTIIDSKEIVVYPDDPKFAIGTYHFVIQACNGSVEHSIGVELELSPVIPVVSLSNPIHNLSNQAAPNSEAIPVTIKDSLFFKYDLNVTEECPDLSQLLISLNIS